MPPRPFPFPLRVGTDICSIARIQKLLTPAPTAQSLPLNRFLPKLLTWPERQYFWHRFKNAESAYNDLNAVSQFLAGRWAAKEACRKACEHLGSSNGFHSMMILPVIPPDDQVDGATSRPQGLILRNRLSEQVVDIAEQWDTPSTLRHAQFDIDCVDGQLCEVSISHDSDWATAVAIVPVLDQWHSKPKPELQKKE